MLARIGNVLGHLRQEIQRLERLEVPAHSGGQIVAGRFGKAPPPIVPAPTGTWRLTIRLQNPQAIPIDWRYSYDIRFILSMITLISL